MKKIAQIMLLFLPLAPLQQSAAESKKPSFGEEYRRGISFAQFARGGKLYQDHCAQCHGRRGEGAPNWQKPGPDGKYPAPPLNGSGHTWHHTRPALTATIKGGTIRIGGSMPPWNDKLTDAEIDDILAWIVLQWPDEIYTAWSKQGR